MQPRAAYFCPAGDPNDGHHLHSYRRDARRRRDPSRGDRLPNGGHGPFWLLPTAFFVLLILAAQSLDALGGDKLLVGLMYLLAGAGKQ